MDAHSSTLRGLSRRAQRTLRRCIAKGLRISDRLQRLVQTHFYARAGQEGRAVLREAADRLYALTLNDGTFVARMTGPLVHILKNVAVNRLQVGFVKIAFRTIAFSNFLHPHRGRAILFHLSSEWVSIPHLFFRTFGRSGLSDVLG